MEEDPLVEALTYPDEDRDLPAQRVRGRLARRHVPSLDYVQCIVDGRVVQPESIHYQRDS
jgi:hypothetical protein